MLPARLVRCSVREGSIVPLWFQAADYPWMRTVLSEIERFGGRALPDLRCRLRDTLPAGATPWKVALLAHLVLLRPRRGSGRAAMPERVRAEVMRGTALCPPRTRTEVLAAAALRLGLSVVEVEALLLADQSSERRVELPGTLPAPSELALRANLALAGTLVGRAERVRIELEGNARAVVRQAQLRGLLVHARELPAPRAGVRLEISGPLVLFRHTQLYARALASLVPLLPWSRRYRVEARIRHRGQDGRLLLASGDPIPPAPEPRRFDSQLEQCFARDFQRLAPDWELVREPEPLASPRGLLFPDFALVHRRDSERRWLLEIAGFWTSDYVREKLARLRAASPRRFLLCLDAERNCGPEDLPASVAVLRFRRRVDVAEVLRLIEEGEGREMPPPARASRDHGGAVSVASTSGAGLPRSRAPGRPGW